MLRGLQHINVYTHKKTGRIQIKRENNQSDFWESTLGKSTMCFSQENKRIWILAPSLFFFPGVQAFLYSEDPVSPLMFLVPDLDLSQQKGLPRLLRKILFPSGGGSICFFLSHKWDWVGWRGTKRSHGSNYPPWHKPFLSLCTQIAPLEPGNWKKIF